MSRSDVLYGAYELKRSYQSHLGWGIAVGAALHVGAILTIPYLIHPEVAVVVGDEPGYWDPSVLEPLPDIDFGTGSPEATTAVFPSPDVVGIPVAIPDDEIEVAYLPPPGEQEPVGRGMTGDGSGQGMSAVWGPGGSGLGGAGSGGEEPAPDVFIAVESQPVRIKHITPDYPEMARLTGREGRVVVRALVDRDGTVRRVEIVKPSGTNVGFDEAAVDAALRCLYKPAIQNGMPVMVWVTYAVEFKLK